MCERLWLAVEELGVLPKAAIVQLPDSLSEETKKVLSDMPPRVVAEILKDVFIANPLLDNEIREKLKEICKERYLTLKDYAGYLMYLNDDDALLHIERLRQL